MKGGFERLRQSGLALLIAVATVDAGTGPCITCTASDFNGDQQVSGLDLAILLGQWGRCRISDSCEADLNSDSIVNGADLALTLGCWGEVSEPILFPGPSYAVGYGAIDVAAGYFNNDQLVDFVTCSIDAGTISIVLGTSAEGFAPAVIVPSGQKPRGVACGDLDGDGDTDVAVASETDFRLWVHWNTGDGTFRNHSNWLVPDRPWAVAAAHLNGDDDLDLAVVEYAGDGVSIFLNSGNELHFAPAEHYSIGSSAPTDLAIADFDNDGDMDIVTSGADGVVSGKVSLLRNNGNGTFATPNLSSTIAEPIHIAAGDMDQDGKVDIAVTNGFGTVVAVQRNLGTGFFASPQSLPTTGSPHALVVADLDEDRDPDIAFLNGTAKQAGVFTNLGRGIFAEPAYFDGPWGMSALTTAGDVVDGSPDLAATSQTGGLLTRFINNGRGAFMAPVMALTGSQYSSLLAIGQFNSDAFPDCVVADTESGLMKVLLNDGDGTLPLTTDTLALPNVARSISAGNLVGDDRAEIVVGTAVALLLVATDTDGAMLPPQSLATGLIVVGDVALSNLDGDDDADIMFADTLHSRIGVIRNLGSGLFSSPTYYPVGGQPRSIAVADFDGDRDADMIMEGGESFASLLRNTGTGSFLPQVQLAGVNGTMLAAGDLNHDGHVDLVAGRTIVSSVDVFLNLGGASFGPATPVYAGESPTIVSLGDVNCDGSVDICTKAGPVALSLLINDGRAGFAAPALFAGRLIASRSVVADLDLDGDLDVVTPQLGEGWLAVHLNRILQP